MNEISKFYITGDHTISNIRKKLIEKSSNFCKNEISFQKNFNKKFNYLTNIVKNHLFYLVRKNYSKKEVYLYMFKLLLKKGANYFTHDTLEKLKIWIKNLESYLSNMPSVSPL